MFIIWFGFFFSSPSRAAASVNIEKIIYLWFPIIFIPGFYVTIVFLIYTSNRRLSQNIGLLLITLSLCLIFTGIIVYSLKKSASKRKITEQYHPYLQIKPPDADKLNYGFSKNSFNIFCLGGSTTEWKSSTGIGWPDMLEKELRFLFKTDSIYVFNFGRQWYTTLHTLINYETNLRHYRPDAIIVMHNINDLLNNADFSYFSNGEFRHDYGHFLGPVVNIIKFKTDRYLSPFRRKLISVWYNNILEPDTFDQDTFPGLESFSRNINTIIDLASIDSTKVILLTQPNILSENMDDQMKNACVMVNYEAVGKDKKWGFNTAIEGMQQYNERIQKISEKRNVYFINLEKFIPKSLKYFSDEVHYTDTTFKVISKVLADEIADLKIIK